MTTPEQGGPRRRAGTAAAAGLALLAAFVLDRLSKEWALRELDDGRAIPLLPTVELKLVFNPGAAFGLGGEAGPILAMGVGVLLLALLVWIVILVRRGAPPAGVVLLAAAAGGGLGNFYDRATRGTDGPLSGPVVDMISVDWFAVFNLADIFTVGGILGWTLLSLLRGAPTKRPTDADA